MRAQIKLGRIFSVGIGLHYSWFIIALLITLSLGGAYPPGVPYGPDNGTLAPTALLQTGDRVLGRCLY